MNVFYDEACFSMEVLGIRKFFKKGIISNNAVHPIFHINQDDKSNPVKYAGHASANFSHEDYILAEIADDGRRFFAKIHF